MTIRPYRTSDTEAIVRLSLRAWAPVFESLEQVMRPEVFEAFYPDGWRISQQKSVESTCADPDQHLWVAEEGGSPVGFVACRLHAEDSLGEIYMVAVDPGHQQQGFGTALTEFACQWLRDAGMSLAMVETGGDPGHAPARRTYERAGFGLLPVARFFRKL